VLDKAGSQSVFKRT